jgi:hypothetical protein
VPQIAGFPSVLSSNVHVDAHLLNVTQVDDCVAEADSWGNTFILRLEPDLSILDAGF